LTLLIAAASIGESDGPAATTATVTRNTDTSSSLLVNLSSGDTSEATVAATVTIAAGQSTSPAFNINAVNDAILDGTQTVGITATAAGHADGTATLDVTDDLPLTLTLVTGTNGDSTSGGGLKDPDGSPYAITATPATGYSFGQWAVTSGDVSFGNDTSASTTVDTAGDATIQANFVVGSFSVSYAGNGSDGGSVPVDASSPYDYTTTVTVLGNTGSLTRTGHTFAGWNTASDGSGTGYAGGDTFIIAEDTTLYAQWTSDTYTISYDGNGHTGGTVPESQTKTYGQALVLAANSGDLVKDGYTFDGWNTASDGSGTGYPVAGSFTTEAATTLYAQWNSPPAVDAGTDQTIYLSASTGWSPADMTTVAWYDAAEENTITQSGGAVSQWNDKSGNGYHMKQTNGTNKPVYTASDSLFGGRPSISTGPSYKFLTMDQSIAVKRMYVVTYYGDGTQTTWTNHNALVGSTDGSVRLTGRANGNKVFDSNSDGKNFDNGGTTYRNGSTIDTNGQVNGLPINGEIFKVTAASAKTAQWRLLGNNASYTLWDGGMGEIIFTDGTEDLETQQKIEGYLAHKWGMAGKLPADHPYQDASPGVAPVVATLDGTVDDADGDSLTFQWTKQAGPDAPVSFANATEADTTAYFTEPGTYTLRLTADDGINQSHDEVQIIVSLPPLTVSIAETEISENGGTGTATISRAGTSGALEIALTSSDIGEATVPGLATIPDGSSSVDVTITGVDDAESDGMQTVTITATATGYADGTDNIDVTDDETGDSYNDWIAGYNVGSQTAPGDDFDGDGVPNAVENYFGTDPSAATTGLAVKQMTMGGNTAFEFSHPVSDTPAPDVSAAYLWSKDLNAFYGSGQSDPEGTIVTFVAGTPSDGQVTVTATATGTATDRVFVVVAVTQQ